MNRRKKILNITTISILIALAAVLSIFDRYISMAIFTAIPLAGAIIPATFKLGIANIVILIIIYNYDFKTGFIAILLKSVIISLFSIVSFLTTFIIGFTGTFLSFLIMYILKKSLSNKKNMIFVSAIGGFTHGAGQLLANAMLYLVGSGVASLGSLLIMTPSVLILGVITGCIIGFVSYQINNVLIRQKILISNNESKNLKEDLHMERPIYIAHRGSKTSGGVENTSYPFLAAASSNRYGGLECDVRVTLDNKFIIMHDETLERLTKEAKVNSTLNVNQVNYSEIKDIELAQSYKDHTYYSKICLFEEYLAICESYQMIPIIELKWTNGINSSNINEEVYDYHNLDLLVTMIKKYHLENLCYVMTSMRGCLKYLRDNYKDLKLQWLCHENVLDYVDWCIENNISIDVEYHQCTPELVDKCHKNNLVINIWTLNDETEQKKYIDMGVDMITSDWLRK